MAASLTAQEIEKNLKSLLSLGGTKASSYPSDRNPIVAQSGPAGQHAVAGTYQEPEAVPPLTNHDAVQQRIYTATGNGARGNGTQGSRKKRNKRKEPKEHVQKNGILLSAHPVPSSYPQQLQLQQPTGFVVENCTRIQDGQQVFATSAAAAASTTAAGARQLESGKSRNSMHAAAALAAATSAGLQLAGDGDQLHGLQLPPAPATSSQPAQQFVVGPSDLAEVSRDASPVRSSPVVDASEAAGCQAGAGRGGGNQTKPVKQLVTAGGIGSSVSTYDSVSWAALLDSNMILELKGKSKRFPNAKYLCHLCDYHMHEVEDVLRHKDLHTHKRKVKAARDDVLLERMPPPTKAHITALEEVLQRAYNSNVLTTEGLSIREKIVSALRDALTVKIPGLSIRLYGSCASGLALASSDVNIALVFPESTNRSDALDLIVETLLENPGLYKFVTKNLTARTPSVSFLVETQAGKPDTTFSLALTDVPKVCSLARFLQECCRLDERVRKLGVLLKLLCKMCRLDSNKDSMLPSVAFSIMAVHFAQQVAPPLLPIFHHYLNKSEEMEFIPEEDIAQAAAAACRQWTVESKQPLAELWLGMFRFFVLEFDSKSIAVSASSSRQLLKSTMKWGGKKLTVQDPVCCRHNITHCVKNAAAFDYVEDCFMEAYRYFAVPQTKTGPAFRYLLPGAAAANVAGSAETTALHSISADGHSAAEQSEADIPDAELSTLLQSMAMTASAGDSFAERQLLASKAAADDNQCQSSQSPKPGSGKKSAPAAANSLGTPEDHGYDPKKVEQLSPADIVFAFDGSLIVKGKPLPKFCSICHQGGHGTEDCDEACLPDIKPLPAFSSGLRKMLDKFLLQILSDSEPSLQDYRARDDLLRLVQRCVEKEYPYARLVLFGSSNNGFGFADSDLDICLTFEGQATIGDMDTTVVIERLARCLRKERDFGSIVPIPTAKVPIVKFYSKMYQLEGDLSLYNTLAQRNTVLLRRYSEIDKRVRLLGYGLKVFAKKCDIGDASRGSLSSYSYVLMVIYYLQQCEPPVLPVLQELRDGLPSTRDYSVYGWDTYFFDQLDKLSTVWPHRGENKKTAAELWIDMFQFYTETFDVQNTVVCIRQRKKLTRLEKLWNGPTIAIEDPFDHEHNLGAALSVKMHTYIMSVLINGRALYGTPPMEHVTDSILCDYFLDTDMLVGDLVLPNDRGCRICHKIGHLARECPIKLNRKERERKAKAKRQQLEDDRRVGTAAPPPQGGPAAVLDAKSPQVAASAAPRSAAAASTSILGQHPATYLMIPPPAMTGFAPGAVGSHLAALAPGGSFQAHRAPAAAAAVAGSTPVAQLRLSGTPPVSSPPHGMVMPLMAADATMPQSAGSKHTVPAGSSAAGRAHVGMPQPAPAVHPHRQWHPAAQQQQQVHAAAHGLTAAASMQLQQPKPPLPMSQHQVPTQALQQQQPHVSGEQRGSGGVAPLYAQPPVAWMQQQQLLPQQQQPPPAGLLPPPPIQEQQLLYLQVFHEQLQQQMAHTLQQLSVAATPEQQQALYGQSMYLRQQLLLASGLLQRAAGATAVQQQQLVLQQQQPVAVAPASMVPTAVPSAGSSRAAMPEPSPSSSPRDMAPAAGVACTSAAAAPAAGPVGSRAVSASVTVPPAVPESQAAAAASASAVPGHSSHHPPTSRPNNPPAAVSKQPKSQQQPAPRAERGGASGHDLHREGSRTVTNSRRPVDATAANDVYAAPDPRYKQPPSRKH